MGVDFEEALEILEHSENFGSFKKILEYQCPILGSAHLLFAGLSRYQIQDPPYWLNQKWFTFIVDISQAFAIKSNQSQAKPSQASSAYCQ